MVLMDELAKFNLRNQRKAQFRKRREAEAEIARRDAAAGEPVGWLGQMEGCPPVLIQDYRNVEICIKSGAFTITPLYTAAQPAVLPPEMLPENTVEIETLHGVKLSQMQRAIAADAYNQCRADALALGAQQQNVVELYKRKSMEVISGQRYSYVLLEDLLPELDAANVKWEVKK